MRRLSENAISKSALSTGSRLRLMGIAFMTVLVGGTLVRTASGANIKPPDTDGWIGAYCVIGPNDLPDKKWPLVGRALPPATLNVDCGTTYPAITSYNVGLASGISTGINKATGPGCPPPPPNNAVNICELNWFEYPAVQVSACVKTIKRIWWTADSCNHKSKFEQIITINDKVQINIPPTPPLKCGAAIPPPPTVTATSTCTPGAPLSVVPVLQPGAPNPDVSCGGKITRTWTAQCPGSPTTTSAMQELTFSAPQGDPTLENVPTGGAVATGAAWPTYTKPTVRAGYGCPSSVVEAPPKDELTACGKKRTITWTPVDCKKNQRTDLAKSAVWEMLDAPPVLSGVPAAASYKCGDAIPAAPTVTAKAPGNPATQITVNYTQEPATLDVSCGGTITRTWTATCPGTTLKTTGTQVLTFSKPNGNPDLVNVPTGGSVATGPAWPAYTKPTVKGDYGCPSSVVEAPPKDELTPCGKKRTITWTPVDCYKKQRPELAKSAVWEMLDAPPVLTGVPADTTYKCGDAIPAAPTVTANAPGNPSTVISVVYAQFPATNPDVSCGGRVTRTWTATCPGSTLKTIGKQVLTFSAKNGEPTLENVPTGGSVASGAAWPAYTKPTVRAGYGCPSSVVEAPPRDELTPCGRKRTITWTPVDCAKKQRPDLAKTAVWEMLDGSGPALTGVPANATLKCGDPVPPPPTVTAKSASNPGTPITVVYKQDPEVVSDPMKLANCGGTITRTWTATCPGTTLKSEGKQVLTWPKDLEKPTLSNVPVDVQVDCDSVPTRVDPTGKDSCDPKPTVAFVGEVKTPLTAPSCANHYKLVRTWKVTDRCDNQQTASQTVTVKPKPPTVTGVGDLGCVWPPNHWYVCFKPQDLKTPTLTSGCKSGTVTYKFSTCKSNQPDNANEAKDPVISRKDMYTGDGNTINDCVVDPAGAWLCVRAERAGGDPYMSGRKYSVGIVADDGCGTATAELGIISVPHDQRDHPECMKTTDYGCGPSATPFCSPKHP